MFRNVCKVVTVVVNILLQIPAFFIILAVFILSFAHSINHLTEVNFRASDCQPDAEDVTAPSICNAQRSEFPKNYFQSVSATYFFMVCDHFERTVSWHHPLIFRLSLIYRYFPSFSFLLYTLDWQLRPC